PRPPRSSPFPYTTLFRSHVLPAVAAFAVLSVRPVSGQDFTVDTTGAGALIDEAFNRPEVMQNLQYLSDVIGPRLTGSPAARRARSEEHTSELQSRFDLVC